MSPPNGHHNVTIDMEGYNDDYIIDDTELVNSTTLVHNINSNKKQIPIYLSVPNFDIPYTKDQLDTLIKNGSVIKNAYTGQILTNIPHIGDDTGFKDKKYHAGNHSIANGIIACHTVK